MTDNRRRQIRQFKSNERSVHRHRGESAADQDEGDVTPVRVMTDYEISSRRAGGGPAANSDRLKSISGRVAKSNPIKPLAKTVATMEPIVARCAETRDRQRFRSRYQHHRLNRVTLRCKVVVCILSFIPFSR